MTGPGPTSLAIPTARPTSSSVHLPSEASGLDPPNEHASESLAGFDPFPIDGYALCECFRQKQADLVCRPTAASLERGSPVSFTSEVLSDAVDLFGVRIVLSKDEGLSLAGRAVLAEVSHDGATEAIC